MGNKVMSQIRFVGYSGDWIECKAVDIFYSVSDKNYPNLPVLSATQEKGMIYRNDVGIDIQYNERSTKNYKRVLPGQFVIHLRSFQGGFAFSEIEGISSPAYTVLDLINKEEDSPLFWKYVLSSDTFIKKLEKVTYGIRDGRSISFKDFSTLKFRVPSYNEQFKIGNFFKQVDKTIALQQQELNTLKQTKQGFLQKMFPKEGESVPEIRFPGFTEEWKKRKLEDVANYRRGSFPQPYGNKEWYDEENGMPFVQVVDVGENLKLVDNTKQKISKLAQPKSVFVEKGKVIITLQGSIGRVAITQYDSYVDRTLLIFENYKVPINKYYFAYIIQRLFEKEKQKAPGGTIKTITKVALSDFVVFLPDEKEQTKIGIFFKQLDDTIALQEKELDTLKQAKKAFLQKMFV